MRLIVSFMFVAVTIFAQNVSVIKVDKITSADDGKFFYPKYIKENLIAFSSQNYQGIWIKENEKRIKQINNYFGSGYDFVFSSADNSFLFRKNDYINGRKYSTLISYDLSSGNENIIIENQRNLVIPNSSTNSAKFYLLQNKLINASNVLSKNSSELAVLANSNGIHVYSNSSEKILKPFGEGNYIWASLSPDQEKILFNYPGKGTYVCDLNGKILFNVGYANYPSWSRDGNWILFMRDIDDGHEIISSDIYLKKYLDDEEINLTNTKDIIELFPSSSSFQDEVLFNTSDGEIYKLTLKFN